ncbi:MAG TPA: phosphatidylserine decarboxylase family protein [Syntrophorhabdales bacterium]|nr:phosphatidylserine decarboxylase family protein [Syntrophorhabdales bacterium]
MRLPVAKEGLLLILLSLLLSLLCYALRIYPLAILLVLLLLFFLYFFRNPSRISTSTGDEIISPADGRVMGVEDLDEGQFLKERVRRIRIFMSVSDVHVNRAPCEGMIEKVEHRSGRFKLAFKKGIDDENERNYIVLKRGDERFLVVQIAGFVARRIICYVKERQSVAKGAIVGMIALGSRVDLYMPTRYEPLVKEGQKVKSGVTVLARSGKERS